MEKNYRLSDWDKKRQEELNSANLPAFWLAYPVVVIGGLWLLVQVLDWANR
jgi:hypothetical protein